MGESAKQEKSMRDEERQNLRNAREKKKKKEILFC